MYKAWASVQNTAKKRGGGLFDIKPVSRPATPNYLTGPPLFAGGNGRLCKPSSPIRQRKPSCAKGYKPRALSRACLEAGPEDVGDSVGSGVWSALFWHSLARPATVVGVESQLLFGGWVSGWTSCKHAGSSLGAQGLQALKPPNTLSPRGRDSSKHLLPALTRSGELYPEGRSCA